jgi:hypothetical protein
MQLIKSQVVITTPIPLDRSAALDSAAALLSVKPEWVSAAEWAESRAHNAQHAQAAIRGGVLSESELDMGHLRAALAHTA